MYLNIKDEAWAVELSKGIEEHMETLTDALYDNDGTDILTDWGTIFCGCWDCFWREALMYLVPRIIHANREGKVEA